jgi:hypothetical protein
MPRVGHLFAWDIPDEPGTRTWHYARTAEGVFEQLSVKAYRAFFDEKAPWPVAAIDGFAYLATFVIEVADRRPGRIVREYHTKHRLLETGYLDEEHWMHGQGTKSEVVIQTLHRSENTDVFAGRRLANLYGWNLTEADIAALVELLTRRGVPRFD